MKKIEDVLSMMGEPYFEPAEEQRSSKLRSKPSGAAKLKRAAKKRRNIRRKSKC